MVSLRADLAFSRRVLEAFGGAGGFAEDGGDGGGAWVVYFNIVKNMRSVLHGWQGPDDAHLVDASAFCKAVARRLAK